MEIWTRHPSKRRRTSNHHEKGLLKIPSSRQVKEEITFRVSGKRAYQAVQHLKQKPIGKPAFAGDVIDIFEVKLPLRHPEVERLFRENSQPGHYYLTEWFISWRQIRKYYTDAELSASRLIHARPIRVFVEGLPQLDYYEYLAHCQCKVPKRQLGPICLSSSLRCKDDVLQLSDGSWACKPEVAEALVASELDKISFTPVFGSKAKSKKWLEDNESLPSQDRLGLPMDGPLESFRLGQQHITEFHWLQAHFKVSSFSIVAPTDGRHTPYVDDALDVKCGCPEVYGGGLVSELYLSQEGEQPGDWFLSKQFLGSSRGQYLPMRQLLLSQRAFKFLQQFRLHNIEFDRVHLVE